MSALAGFRYRDIVKRLKALGLEFHRQAAGSREIWFNPAQKRYNEMGVLINRSQDVDLYRETYDEEATCCGPRTSPCRLEAVRTAHYSFNWSS